MATLTIRNLPEEARDALRRQAADNRRSMEAEARALICAGVRRAPDAAKRAAAIARLQAMGDKLKKRLPEGWSVVDEFLAEKHLEGAWENGLVSDDERAAWRERLGRYEIQPAELEAFVAGRLSGK